MQEGALGNAIPTTNCCVRPQLRCKHVLAWRWFILWDQT